MYLDFKVAMPETKGITVKRIKNIPYVYLEYGRVYLPEKKYNTAKRVCIGKACADQPGMMIPNTNFVKYFPEEAFPEGIDEVVRSSCIHVGAFFVIRKIIKENFLDRMRAEVIGRDAELLLELAVYSLLTEGNAAQYYQDYAYNHPALTEKMEICSDSKIFDFLKNISEEQRHTILNKWNAKSNHRERIYISCDSVNGHRQADEVDIAEVGHTKDNEEKSVINYMIAYNANSMKPLFYDIYHGSIAEVGQLWFMLDKAVGYGYQQIGFILNHEYLSKENIQLLDQNGCDFIIMVGGGNKIVREVVWEMVGTFEQNSANIIPEYQVSGTTVKHRLFPSDGQERYFHIYYNEQEHITKCGKKLMEAINEDIKLYGYFVIITSEKMTAEKALTLYMSGNDSEKLFCGNKLYFQDDSKRIYEYQLVDTKTFIGFVALIIRNQIDMRLKESMLQDKKKWNCITVSAALRKLEKIEMIKGLDNVYRLDHDVTVTQREILNAFGMTNQDIKVQAKQFSRELMQIDRKGVDYDTYYK